MHMKTMLQKTDGVELNFADRTELCFLISVGSQPLSAWLSASKLLPCLPLPNP
jgi:hypothetical protein